MNLLYIGAYKRLPEKNRTKRVRRNLPSYYEKKILQVLDQNKDGLTTMSIAEKADISKTTALKYLAGLRSMGEIEFMEVGPAKLWRLVPPKENKDKHMPVNRMKRIESALKEFKEAVGLEGSAVVDNQGLPISCDLPWDVNPEKMGTLISRLLEIGVRSSNMAKIDPLKDIILEGEKGRIVTRSEKNVLLVAFSGPETPLGMVRLEIEEFARKINELLT